VNYQDFVYLNSLYYKVLLVQLFASDIAIGILSEAKQRYLEGIFNNMFSSLSYFFYLAVIP
jgi:hypothetical protein